MQLYPATWPFPFPEPPYRRAAERHQSVGAGVGPGVGSALGAGVVGAGVGSGVVGAGVGSAVGSALRVDRIRETEFSLVGELKRHVGIMF